MWKIYSFVLIWVFVLLWSFVFVYADSFKIDSVEIIEKDIIEVIFTRELDQDPLAIRELTIEKTWSSDEIEILLSEVNPQDPFALTLLLDEFLEEDTSYTITIFDIKDVDGNTVETGLDSVFIFESGRLSIGEWQDWSNEENLTWDVVADEQLLGMLNQATQSSEDEIHQSSEDVAIEDNQIDVVEDDSALHSAPEYEDEMENQEYTWDSVLDQAEQNETLPETGPEILFLIFIVFIITWGYLYVRRKA